MGETPSLNNGRFFFSYKFGLNCPCYRIHSKMLVNEYNTEYTDNSLPWESHYMRFIELDTEG